MDGKFQLVVLTVIYFLICEADRVQSKNFNKISTKCAKCPPGWGVSKKCTKNSDTECVKCLQSKTYSPRHSSKSRCWLCSQCGVGLFESHGCSPVRDTICSECVSYLDHKNLRNNGDFLEKCGENCNSYQKTLKPYKWDMLSSCLTTFSDPVESTVI